MKIGVVIIGRNEGERLKRCISSVIKLTSFLVYVDSGSDDDSVEYCEGIGVRVIELDTTTAFSAARARNAGFRELLRIDPEIMFVQFVDGDCEVDQNWLNVASNALLADGKVAIVCGRRRERYPDASLYNALCDIEWNTAVGITRSCGGDFMVRAEAMEEVSGFNSSVIAGEEPELCYRLRANGWLIERIDAEMTIHDAMMHDLSQWWRRTMRSGHAYAQNMFLHWGEGEKLNVRAVASIAIWGLIIPVSAALSILLAVFVQKYFWIMTLVIVFFYLFSLFRIYRNSKRSKGLPNKESLLYSGFILFGKIPQILGVLSYTKKHLMNETPQIIEYQ